MKQTTRIVEYYDIGPDQIIPVYEAQGSKHVEIETLPNVALNALRSWLGDEKPLPEKMILRDFMDFLGGYCPAGRWRVLRKKLSND